MGRFTTGARILLGETIVKPGAAEVHCTGGSAMGKSSFCVWHVCGLARALDVLFSFGHPGSVERPATARWRNTTHNWAMGMDVAHLEQIRRTPAVFAPGGAMHLVLEVLAYAADEAECSGPGKAVVTVHPDGSVSITDNGRGTDTRADNHGRMVKKPVMATKDMRFFDIPEAVVLPDGHPRRGMSVVAALSEWLMHTNRRREGAWTQRYEHGIPITALMPVPNDDVTGTTVHFLPDPTLVRDTHIPGRDLRHLAVAYGPHLLVEVIDEPP